MSRRLLEVRGGKALYEYDEPGIGKYQVWELAPLRDLGDIAPLASSERPVSFPSGGLYGRSEEQRRNDTRRAADRALEKHGLRPGRTW